MVVRVWVERIVERPFKAEKTLCVIQWVCVLFSYICLDSQNGQQRVNPSMSNGLGETRFQFHHIDDCTCTNLVGRVVNEKGYSHVGQGLILSVGVI